MEKEKKSPELVVLLKESIESQIKSYKYDISYAREKIERAKKRKALKIALVRQVEKALEGVSPELIEKVSTGFDDVHIYCVNEAASSIIVSQIVQNTVFSLFHKEMRGRNDRAEWYYLGETVIDPSDDKEQWNTEKFKVYISPSYPNPECLPLKKEQVSKYTTWECIKST